MQKLFKVYVISICIVILGTLMNGINGGAEYLTIIILLLFLLLTSMDLKCIKRREFLFVQLILIIALAINKIASKANIIIFLFRFGYDHISYPVTPLLYWVSIILEILGYIGLIISLVKYNVAEKNN